MNLSHAEHTQGEATAQGKNCHSHEWPKQPHGSERPLLRQTVVVCNSQGGEEAFTVGPDGCVWNFFPDAASDSGYTLMNLHIPTDVMAVSRDADRWMVVFSAAGMKLFYREERPTFCCNPQSSLDQRWSDLKAVALPLVRGAVAVKRLFVKDVGDAMHIGAVVSLKTANCGEACVLAYAKWTREGLTFPEPSILLDGDPRVSPDSSSASPYLNSRRRALSASSPSSGPRSVRSVLIRPWRIGLTAGWI